MIGDKRHTEALDFYASRSGRRAFSMRRSRLVMDGGVLRSEDADMSSDKPGKIPGRRKPKVSWGRFVLPGLAGS
jgi:hypothetical protein